MKRITSIFLMILTITFICGCENDNIKASEKTEPICSHEWVLATCTSAKKCSVCGKVEGEPLGHSWSEATCSSPSTCSRCGITNGSPKEHNYANGKCVYCGAVDPKVDNIRQALESVERYITYLSTERKIVISALEKYEIAKQISFTHQIDALNSIISAANDIADEIDSIMSKCGQYNELKPLTNNCKYQLPAVSSKDSSTIPSYISAVKSLNTMAQHAIESYNVLCSQYF